MTRRRYDEHTTQFGLWLRNQWELELDPCPACGFRRAIQLPGHKRDPDVLESGLGFVATNLDYIWANYKRHTWMLIEEKRYGSRNTKPCYSQGKQFETIAAACRGAVGYGGWHLLVFEKTNPEDGEMWLDGKEIDKAELIAFLRFEEPRGVSASSLLFL